MTPEQCQYVIRASVVIEGGKAYFSLERYKAAMRAIAAYPRTGEQNHMTTNG